ncbi:hypothetical protein D6D17_02643 [Aureobasidium pullulans]|uniref:YTH domain-containing protein n=1 Tax=Aureobasidium pullulans TaxID=5580 RepID=A0A4S8TP22_AURPU|nr:hypothetical protein D6D29_01559 [Aureobasidium pullulans]THW37930.1 hypothetical protein D6D21_08035 [Aureobasidium pullulans]THX16921.1 hypothetical protein D6D17_02643 [Aureobasidium pullulans]THY46847.1 hypothetical protein D6C98_07322 [Aureobasidium pullulans]THZ66585.1 hypothetical protein D6C85_08010 [Aureobasidium pullulans]
MGEAPQAQGDRQASAYSDHQDSTKLINMDHSPGKNLRDEQSAPFYSQFDAFPHAPHAQHGTYPSYQSQQSMDRLGMSSMGLALPETFTSSTPTRVFSQPAPPYANGSLPPGMEYRPQALPYGSQIYPPNVAMHASMPRTHMHASLFASHYYYNSYGAPQPPGQPLTGYATMPPHGKADTTGQHMLSQPYSGLARRDITAQAAPSYPRGPPRKPRQSGYALWVGNLPPDTTIIALKEHFSREATNDIESLFLIAKSNCAFVNYRTEAACMAAMERFHDSRFQSVRLVCRPRRGTPNGGSSSSTPDSITPNSSNENDKPSRKVVPRLPSGPVIVDSSAGHSPKKATQQKLSESPEGTDGVDGANGVDGAAGFNSARVPEKYFVVKSLTLQDLEASVRNGVWATQSHNEVALNRAYESADSVFLVFSANKSGEYFGYARMLSPITSDSAAPSVSLRPRPQDLDNGPKSIPTPATQWAPKGRVVDDSARGTIFWEVDNSESEEGADGVASQQPQEEKAGSKQVQEWGKSFKVEWISTNRLPFYRTRGLRNPWNENREIKIARDGTEIEPSIGQRLVQMFHRPAPLPQGIVGMPPVNPAMAQHFPA